MKPSWQDVWWWEPCWGGKIKINRALFSAKLGWCLRASYSPGLEPSKRSLGGASDVKKLVGGPFLYLHQLGPDLKYRGTIWWTRLLRWRPVWISGEWLLGSDLMRLEGLVCCLLEKKVWGGNLLHLRNRRIQGSWRKLDTKDWEILIQSSKQALFVVRTVQFATTFLSGSVRKFGSYKWIGSGMACRTIIVTEYIVGFFLATPRGKPQWLGYLCAYMVMGEVAGLGTMPGGSNIFPWTAGFSVNCGSFPGWEFLGWGLISPLWKYRVSWLSGSFARV